MLVLSIAAGGLLGGGLYWRERNPPSKAEAKAPPPLFQKHPGTALALFALYALFAILLTCQSLTAAPTFRPPVHDCITPPRRACFFPAHGS